MRQEVWVERNEIIDAYQSLPKETNIHRKNEMKIG